MKAHIGKEVIQKMKRQHGMNRSMWTLIKRTCTTGDACHMKFSNLFGYLFSSGDFERYSEEQLTELSNTMKETTLDYENAEAPIGFAFFGQFVDHDITFDIVTKLGQAAGNIDKIENLRTPKFDLDSIYLSGPEGSPFLYDGDKLIIGTEENPLDLQRNRLGTAIIGDPRNDENIFISQIQSLFIRFHNWCIDEGMDFEKAREFVRWTYQKIIVHEFLPAIIEESVLRKFIEGFYAGKLPGPVKWSENTIMPVEFSAAAFRFGHSHVRQDYRLNDDIAGDLFDFSSFEPVASDHNLDWKYFFNLDGTSFLQAKPIDTHLAKDLFQLPFARNSNANLASRNLIRGQGTFGLLTGEEVARLFGIEPISMPTIAKKILGKNATPLWYYILAEAEKRNGKLGEVGGSLVCGVLLQMLLSDEESYIHNTPDFNPFEKLPFKDSIIASIAELLNVNSEIV